MRPYCPEKAQNKRDGESGMIAFPEAGYTPANIRALLKHAGLTQSAAGELLGVDTRTVRKWCAPLDSDHADMPHRRWLQLLNATTTL